MENKSEYCWYKVAMGSLVFVIVLCIFACCSCLCCGCKDSITQLATQLCVQLVVIPTALICLTYLASLLIKKMPDLDKESERKYRWETRNSGQ